MSVVYLLVSFHRCDVIIIEFHILSVVVNVAPAVTTFCEEFKIFVYSDH